MVLTRLPFIRKLLDWRLFVVLYVVAWVALLAFAWLTWSTLSMISKVTLGVVLVLTTPALDDVARAFNRGNSGDRR